MAGEAAPGPHIDTQSADHSCKDSHATPFPSAGRGVRTAADGRVHQRQHPAGAAERPRIPHSIAGETSRALPARALFIYPGRFSSPQTAPAPWPYNSRYRECPRPRSSGGCTGADAFPYNLRLYGIKSALPGRQHERGIPPLKLSPLQGASPPHPPAASTSITLRDQQDAGTTMT